MKTGMIRDANIPGGGETGLAQLRGARSCHFFVVVLGLLGQFGQNIFFKIFVLDLPWLSLSLLLGHDVSG